MKNLLVCILSLLLVSVNAQEVTTIAGTGTLGGADGPAAEATFNNPHGIATDDQGNIYVADRYGHKIRKISTSGVVTTLAGSGNIGSENGTGTEASFYEPWAICVGGDGNIYVTDTKNNLIRKITPQGEVSTFAGNGSFGITNGPALSASFGYPTGIEIDDAGNLYIADHLTHIIRKITPDGTVSRLAGAPYCSGLVNGMGDQALFNRPYGLSIDPSGNIIVADEWNHAIRSVSPTTGEVTTLGGNGTLGHDDGDGSYSTFNYPWDVTVDDAGNIFVVDGYNHSIRKLIPTPSVPVSYGVLTFAGVSTLSGWVDGYGTEASFNGAAGLDYNKLTGEVFVADTYNNRIRKIVDNEEQSVLLNIVDNEQGVICTNESFKAEAFPTAFETYIFFVDGQIVQSGSNEACAVSNLNSGEHSIMVHGINTNGTYISDEFNFTVLDAPTPVIEIDGVLPMPQESSVVLTTDESVAVSCTWSNGANTPDIIVDEPEVVTVDVLFNNGCIGTSEPINIQQFCSIETPLIEFADNSLDCDCFINSTTMVTDYTGDGDIQWLYYGVPIDGATESSYEVTHTGVYQVLITAFEQQVYSNVLHAHISDPIVEDFKANKTLLFDGDDKVKFTPDLYYNYGYYSYEWNFGDYASGDDNFSDKKKPRHEYSGVGVYSVTLKVTDNYTGCIQTIYKPDMIIYGEEFGGGSDDRSDNIIYIPNAFSPNGDGENDVLQVRGEEIKSMEFYVYNQKGGLVFESRDQSLGWDGNIQGRPAANETYNYILKAEMNNGTKEARNGKVFVIR